MNASRSTVVRTLMGAVLGIGLLASAPAHAQSGESLARTQFTAGYAGEAKLALTASAPGTDWGTAGKESAMLEVAVDGRPVTNVVTFRGAVPHRYDLALGRVSAGKHELTVKVDAAKSPTLQAEVTSMQPSLATEGDVVARYAPIPRRCSSARTRPIPRTPRRWERRSVSASGSRS